MELLQFLTVVVFALVLVIAWRRIGGLEKEIEFVRRRNQDRVWELAQEIENLTGEVRRLRTRVRSGGVTKFTPDVTMEELPDIHPLAPQVLAGFHIGGCSSCAVDDNATLADAVAEKGANLDTVLSALNGLLEGRTDLQRDLDRIGTSGLLQIQSSR